MGQVENSKSYLLEMFCSVLPLKRMRQVQGMSSVNYFPSLVFWFVGKCYLHEGTALPLSPILSIAAIEAEFSGVAG